MKHTPLLNPDSSLRAILVVEDNDMDLDLLLSAFQEHAVANPVIACRDGEEALVFIDAHPDPTDPQFPLVVLLDLRLPKVDGLDVLQHARGKAPWSSVPIVILTTSRENGDLERAYALGANSYLVKPVDFNSFSDVIKEFKVYWILTNEPPFPSPGGAVG